MGKNTFFNPWSDWDNPNSTKTMDVPWGNDDNDCDDDDSDDDGDGDDFNQHLIS
jgi:hypothetical protein